MSRYYAFLIATKKRNRLYMHKNPDLFLLLHIVWGYLFHNRLSRSRDEGLFFYHPGSPNSPGQMLNAKILSQHLVSSSKAIRPDFLWGTRYAGQ